MGFNSRLDEVAETISELKDEAVEFTQSEQLKEKRLRKSEYTLRDLWDNAKQTDIVIIGVPEGEETQKEAEKLFEGITAKNVPNLGRK